MTDDIRLKVQIEREEAAVVICPSGRIDGSNVDVLEKTIDEQISAGEKALIFDFTDLNYISSAGLRVLLVTARRMQQGEGCTLFCALAEHIATIFEISGFKSILQVCETRNDALAAL